MKINIKNDWKVILQDELKSSNFKNLINFLSSQDLNKVYPQEKDIFNALNFTSFENTRVIIIGQDPYHGEGQAHGISFSVQKGNKIPPSLKNIYKELKRDLNLVTPEHGNLESWCNQGVLMLNSVLTVAEQQPGSHRKKGWEEFTDSIINKLNQDKMNLVFILWGNDAKKKALNVDRNKHLVLESAHPSPFSVKNFAGNSHFSITNQYLKSKNLKEINWAIL